MQGPEVAGPQVGRQYGILWSLNPNGIFRRGSEGPMLGHVDMEGDYLLPQQLDLNQEHLCSFPNGPMTLPNFSELQSPSSQHDLKKEDGCPQNVI